MKFVKLKKSFVQEACKIDKEFEQKEWRGYAIVIELSTEKYLVPLRSNCKHKYCFKNKVSNKYLDYTKSFVLVNEKIIDQIIVLEEIEYLFYQKNIKKISSELSRFNTKRSNISFAVDNELIKKVQSIMRL
ncbi:hypothetical protein RZE82_07110 [Mollicutes bacterium LVI A0039]|nr:hypothetical protein RZE82_07110 [Mollicutes bacterium LVI A0039]